MALFVQIDHFRKTDQKPTVKNHLFSISWFRSFNRTSFQQQLKHKLRNPLSKRVQLQSYILSTTTETCGRCSGMRERGSFNRTSFQQQLKQWDVKAFYEDLRLQSYILSTTTETELSRLKASCWSGFNRTSFQQQLKLIDRLGK